ncbi:FAD-binding and (Fe-S)-binding domain-containing protein [Amnibacterium sp.]|uniref:FAD-binding and (Fe-S)-binding domain-containing protein n=1 Tax=Amnibacterium sp. TaxID=1872496 RepID=UPI003F7BC41E
MAATLLPSPIVRPADPAGDVDVETLRRALVANVDGEVRFDEGSRATYATDSSNYRQVPIGVVVPRTIDAGVRAVQICSRYGAPVLSRGGGTSLAGECTNTAVVIDWTKYCNRVEHLDVDAKVALVQPGIVLDELNAFVAPHGLMVGPKPATHDRCTIGGMLGNNSCGSTAQAYGKAVDNVRRMEVLLYDGTRMWVGGDGDRFDEVVRAGGRPAEIYRGLKYLAEEYGDDIRSRYPDIPRRVSGYNLDDLLPEKGFDLARALTGSEATLVTILRAEVTLVPTVPAQRFVMLGYPDVASAADHTTLINPHEPMIFEGLDRRLIDHEKVKHLNPTALDLLPEGDAWLLLVFGGKDDDEAKRRADALVEAVRGTEHPPSVAVFEKPEDQEHIMKVRESGLGATAWVPDEHSTWPGWEDAAVPPDRLGDYLRDFRDLLDEFGFGRTAIYGHFGQGCVHCRIPFDFTTKRGIAHFEQFIERAAHLVVDYGGSLSGEHGDGQARGPLLPIMFGDRLIEAMERMKALFDPTDRMNPGKVVQPYGPAENLRLGTDYRPHVGSTHFAYPEDRGLFENAALRCVGVGACRSHEGGVMCPSYRATGEEEHSTRGRSRLLFEMVNGKQKGGPIQDGWRSEAVKDALDLCLSCKGCKSDCPVNVDMATYKAEFLSHHYKGRLRPLAHYSMGWLPLFARFAHLAAPLINTLTHAPVLRTVVRAAGGVDQGRPLPTFAPERFSDWFRRRKPVGTGLRGDVLLFPDTFNNTMHPAVAKAAVTVLEEAGYRVVLPEQTLCCGLTWVSTGQLDVAKRMLKHTAHTLAPYFRRGVPLVGLEPSCTAVFRSDGPDLLPEDEDVKLLKEHTKTLAELLDATDGWLPPKIDRKAVVQPHCHQHAVLSVDADQRILAQAGIDAQVLGGCCGLAGNFGFEKGHLDVSIGAAKHELLPAVNAADPDVLVLADGFSCQTQTEHLSNGRGAMHLAEILALGIQEAKLGAKPERLIERPGRRHRVSRRRIARVHPFGKASRPDGGS